MTRDELQRNLLQIQPCIVRISQLQSQQIKLSAQFQREKAQISTSGSSMAKIIAAALAAAAYGVAIANCLLQGEIQTLLIGIAITAISAIGFKNLFKIFSKGKKADKMRKSAKEKEICTLIRVTSAENSLI